MCQHLKHCPRCDAERAGDGVASKSVVKRVTHLERIERAEAKGGVAKPLTPTTRGVVEVMVDVADRLRGRGAKR